MVHEHHARTLHYDLRLELQGTLKSWAVPKGPSMDPADRRLAIEVDDHELAYADFEGTIPKGQYGAGEVAVWDRGSVAFISGSHQEGRLEFELSGAKLSGRFVLIRTEKKGLPRRPDRRQWLLIKKKDGLEIRGFRLRRILP